MGEEEGAAATAAACVAPCVAACRHSQTYSPSCGGSARRRTPTRARRSATFQVDELLRRLSSFPARTRFSTTTSFWSTVPKWSRNRLDFFSVLLNSSWRVEGRNKSGTTGSMSLTAAAAACACRSGIFHSGFLLIRGAYIASRARQVYFQAQNLMHAFVAKCTPRLAPGSSLLFYCLSR